MSKNTTNESLIFIPDISGFTKFVNETELSHSQHIIQELLEVLLESNAINLNVSEIEGDAILFYKLKSLPDLNEIADQIKSMFIAFHKHLKIIERDRVCHCGACSTAINLTLKFLVHSGEITESVIKDHKKLMGKDVIVAHRLLKNNIKNDEYSLITDDYFNSLGYKNYQDYFDWDEFCSGEMSYEHLGLVQFKYINLSPLKKNIAVALKNETVKKYPDPIINSITINAPIEMVYNTIIDLDLRSKWTKGLVNLEYNKNEIPKIGTTHRCEFESGSFNIETIFADKSENKLEIAERANNNVLFPQATTLFILSKRQENTLLQVEAYYKRRFIFGKLFDLLFRSKFDNSIKQSISLLKKYCENQTKH